MLWCKWLIIKKLNLKNPFGVCKVIIRCAVRVTMSDCQWTPSKAFPNRLWQVQQTLTPVKVCWERPCCGLVTVPGFHVLALSGVSTKPKLWMHTNAHTHTQMHTHTHMHTLTRKCTHSHAHAHTHTQMHTLTRTCTLTHKCTHSHTNAHTHTHMHTLTRKCTHSHAHAHTHAQMHTHTHMHTLTHTCTHSHAHAHSHFYMHVHHQWHQITLPSITHTHKHTITHLPEYSDESSYVIDNKLGIVCGLVTVELDNLMGEGNKESHVHAHHYAHT